eukprot:CAMPEP_0114980810 /NCGR_PEP_ID=MMETSP0216-20121206/5179_1 /TAXON_ID=223996 /ORGANISM="Protocruzia adherens, Strain Boccale" /LENGTH=232 /DNA_ID=CAMNT_0002342379 /DNA_START=13 /DNA_END=707 /DNA_ORIENTATION=+
MDDSTKTSKEELLAMAEKFVCPVHPDRQITDDRSVGCQECIEGKPEEFQVQRVKSHSKALETIENLFTQSYCTTHPRKEAQMFCKTEKIGRCLECISNQCGPSQHEFVEIKPLYHEKITESKRVQTLMTEYKDRYSQKAKRAFEKFETVEIERVNTAFDEFVKGIEQMRERTISDMHTRIDDYRRRLNCLHDQETAELEGILDPAKWESLQNAQLIAYNPKFNKSYRPEEKT